MKVGFFQAKDAGAALKSLGYSGLSTGNGALQAQVATSLVNSSGGLDGHPIRAVVFEVDLTQNFVTQEQEACQLFFADNHVIAVESVVETASVLRACAQQHGVPFVSENASQSTSSATLRTDPLMVLGSTLSLDRDVSTLVRYLVRSGWFRPSSPTDVVRVGLIYTDLPEFRQVPAQVQAQLRKAGLQLLDSEAAPYVTSTSDVSQGAAAGQSAALRFSSEHISRVIVVDANGNGLSYFALAASQDHYYPRFGISTLQEPALLPVLMSSKQLSGAAGVGWAPVFDVPVSAQPAGSHITKVCVTAMSKAGEDMTVLATRQYAEITCEGAYLLAAAWHTGPLTSPGFLTGLRTLGAGWKPVIGFASDFSDRHDGTSQVRPLAWSTRCGCFTYTGPPQPAAAS